MIQATFILVVAWCSAKALTRRSSAERHMLWAAALGAAAVLPLLSVLLGTWQPRWARTVAEIFPAIIRTSSSQLPAYGADIVVHAGALESAETTVLRVIAVIWLMGTSVAFVALLAGAQRLGRLAKLARPVTDESWLGLATDVCRRLEIRQRVSLLQSPAGFGLDQNALVALRQWQFRPGMKGGEPVDMSAEIEIEFNLRNEALNELIANDMATRIGPDVIAPRIVRRVDVPPPRDAGGERGAGTVVLDVVLLEDGSPKIVRVLQSVTPQLDERAVGAFEQWRFSPAMKAGRPVKVRLKADITFR